MPGLGVLLVDEAIFGFDWTHCSRASRIIPVADRQQTPKELEWFDVEGAANSEFLALTLGSDPWGWGGGGGMSPFPQLYLESRMLASVIDQDPSRILSGQLSKLWSSWTPGRMC